MINLDKAVTCTTDECDFDTTYHYTHTMDDGSTRPIVVRYSFEDDKPPVIDLPDGAYAVAYLSPDLTRGVEQANLSNDSLWISDAPADVRDGQIDALDFAHCVADCLAKCGYWGSFIEEIKPVWIGDTKFLMVHLGS